MSRPIPAALKAELEQLTPSAGLCLILEAKDGARARFTTLTDDFVVDLALGGGDEVCSEKMSASALTLATGLDANFYEISGAFGGQITEAQLAGGRWTDAKAWLVEVSSLVPGEWSPKLYGRVREPRAEEHSFTFEVRGIEDMLNVTLGEVFGPLCKVREFGNARCGFPVVPVAATVSAVTDSMRFLVSYAGTYADDYFRLGKADFLTGELAGVRADNIFSFASLGAGAGSIELRVPLFQAPEVGDTLELRQDCDRTRPSCIFFHGDARPFLGHADMPGTEQYVKYPNPGAQG